MNYFDLNCIVLTTFLTGINVGIFIYSWREKKHKKKMEKIDNELHAIAYFFKENR